MAAVTGYSPSVSRQSSPETGYTAAGVVTCVLLRRCFRTGSLMCVLSSTSLHAFGGCYDMTSSLCRSHRHKHTHTHTHLQNVHHSTHTHAQALISGGCFDRSVSSASSSSWPTFSLLPFFFSLPLSPPPQASVVSPRLSPPSSCEGRP